MASKKSALARSKRAGPRASETAKKAAAKKKPVSREVRLGAARTKGARASAAATTSPQTPLQIEARASVREHRSHRDDGEYVERAARILLEGSSQQEADPIVLDAVATIMQRIADHACALELGTTGAQRVAAADALGKVQVLLARLAEPRRAEFVALVQDHARRLHRLPAEHDASDELAIAKAFITSATRFDRAFRRLGQDYVRSELLRLKPARSKGKAQAPGPAVVAGAMSAKVGAFNDRSPKLAASNFDKAWKNRSGAEPKAQQR